MLRLARTFIVSEDFLFFGDFVNSRLTDKHSIELQIVNLAKRAPA